MKIAVEGCCHGELDKIYETIAHLEQKSGVKVDLLICCGDFQAVRNPSDLSAMAVPPKYQKMNTFYKYYSGEKKAPILTVFIGGNHEASNYLQELAYGGWVARNIYYLGYAGVIQIGGVRIGGLSGIYKSQDYLKGRHEHLPYNDSTKRSVYHIRNIDVFRLKQDIISCDGAIYRRTFCCIAGHFFTLKADPATQAILAFRKLGSVSLDILSLEKWPASLAAAYNIANKEKFAVFRLKRPVDIMLSHDWPEGVYNHGNSKRLARAKPFFVDDMANGRLGSPPAADLMYELKPKYWFSAHLHTKFAARVEHECEDGSKKETRFLSLDKCLPRRRFLQLLDIPHDTSKDLKLQLDPEWLCILKATDHLLKTTPSNTFMPGRGGPKDERIDFTMTDKDISEVKKDFGGDLTIPENFERTAEKYHTSHGPPESLRRHPRIHINPQTTLLCEMLGITDPITHFTQEKPVLNLAVDSKVEVRDSSSGSESGSDSNSESDEKESSSYDSFIVSHDQSSLALSSSNRLDDSLDEKYVTAVENMSVFSQSAISEDVSERSLSQDSASPPQGLLSPPHGLLSPPLTSGEEQSSDKDTSVYFSAEGVSPKRTLESEEPAQALFSTPKPGAKPETPNIPQETPPSQPKKFKRRNQSFYESTD